MRGEEIGVELDRGGEPALRTARNAFELSERRDEVAEHRLELERALDEPLALDDVEVDEAGDAGAGMTRVRATVEERRRRSARTAPGPALTR